MRTDYVYQQEDYKGLEINCGMNKECDEHVLELLRVLTCETSLRFKRPIGFHLRVRFSEEFIPSKFSDRLNKHFNRPSKKRLPSQCFQPAFVRVTEDDPGYDGEHHHFAMVIDGQYATIVALGSLLRKLQRNGLINDYKLITPYNCNFGMDLSTLEGKKDYFKWLSYIAKTRTKEAGKQTVSSSRNVTLH